MPNSDACQDGGCEIKVKDEASCRSVANTTGFGQEIQHRGSYAQQIDFLPLPSFWKEQLALPEYLLVRTR